MTISIIFFSREKLTKSQGVNLKSNSFKDLLNTINFNAIVYLRRVKRMGFLFLPFYETDVVLRAFEFELKSLPLTNIRFTENLFHIFFKWLKKITKSIENCSQNKLQSTSRINEIYWGMQKRERGKSKPYLLINQSFMYVQIGMNDFKSYMDGV